MSEILLVRHGEPALRGVLLGATDPCLSEAGLRQAREAAKALQSKAAEAQPRVVYSSPMRRALQTASCFVTPTRPLVVLHALREISYGDWDGLPWETIEGMNPALARQKADDWLNVVVPGAESWSSFAYRVQSALAVVKQGPLPALVVAHQGVNAELAHQLTGSLQTDFHQNYCELLSYASHTD